MDWNGLDQNVIIQSYFSVRKIFPKYFGLGTAPIFIHLKFEKSLQFVPFRNILKTVQNFSYEILHIVYFTLHISKKKQQKFFSCDKISDLLRTPYLTYNYKMKRLKSMDLVLRDARCFRSSLEIKIFGEPPHVVRQVLLQKGFVILGCSLSCLGSAQQLDISLFREKN